MEEMCKGILICLLSFGPYIGHLRGILGCSTICQEWKWELSINARAPSTSATYAFVLTVANEGTLFPNNQVHVKHRKNGCV